MQSILLVDILSKNYFQIGISSTNSVPIFDYKIIWNTENSTHLVLRRPLQASRVPVRGQAPNATIPSSARRARVVGRKPTYRAKVALRNPRRWHLRWSVAGHRLAAIVVHLATCQMFAVLLQQLRKAFAIARLHVVGGFAFVVLLAIGARLLEAVVELGHLLRHDQIGVRIIVEVVLLQGLQCFARPAVARRIVEHAFLVGVLDTIWLAGGHFNCTD